MKECFKCGEVKSLSEFYKHSRMADGHVNKCKECNKRDVRDNRAKKVEYYREYDKRRFQEDPKVKERNKKYASSDRGKEVSRASCLKYIEENPIKRAAHIQLGNAVRDGRVSKSSSCESCGDSESRLHGHHDDYAYPLSVRWLCPKCHTQWHRDNGEGANAH